MFVFVVELRLGLETAERGMERGRDGEREREKRERERGRDKPRSHRPQAKIVGVEGGSSPQSRRSPLSPRAGSEGSGHKAVEKEG